MARQANIVAFDEVKKTSSATRSSVARAKKPTSKKQAPASAKHATKNTRQKSVERSRNAKTQSAAVHENEEQDTVAKKTRQTKAAERKRNRKKAKAEKAFTKQFAGKESSSAASEGAPRAALYKTEMGKSHKRAAKAVQEKGGFSSVSSKIPKPHFQKGISLGSSRMRMVATLVVCLVLSGAFIYPSAQQYYAVTRQHDQLQAEYEALETRNNTIRSEVDTLMTDEGIQDKARREFGWVLSEEGSVDVYGLPEKDTRFNYTKAIPTGSVEAPQTWYSPFLDFFFNV